MTMQINRMMLMLISDAVTVLQIRRVVLMVISDSGSSFAKFYNKESVSKAVSIQT